MDTYAIVTEKIINLLEQGMVPWRRPWSATGLPRNLVSKKPYRGINLFLLSATKYVSPFWLYHEAGEPARRIGAQGRAQPNGDVLGRSNP
jgi:antirestriction protein ArdC